MFNRRSFKTDESFLEKIAIGAIGTRRVFEHLQQQGHSPIELERGSMSYKIWKNIKIKRIRVPDILLLNANRRIESRAKTKLEITMSHSFSNRERAWDSGLADEDYVALVGVHRSGERPVDWQADTLVQYIAVRDLRTAYLSGSIVREKPKGAQEGFEERVTWPCTIASADGTVHWMSEDRLQYQRSVDSRVVSLRLLKSGISLIPQVKVGDAITENQILAAVVPVIQSIPAQQPVSADVYVSQLHSSSQSERYTAAKALFYFDSPGVRSALIEKVQDDKDHIYVRLDAAASLARHHDKVGYNFIEECLHQPYVESQLEAVIVLAEIAGSVAIEMLQDVLQRSDYHPEVRAGAAWALGEIRSPIALQTLVRSFNETTEIIRIEAARALAKIAETHLEEIISLLPTGQTVERPGIAWALSQIGRISVDQLLGILRDDDTRRWVSFILGSQRPELYIDQIERLQQIDPEIYFAVTVLWQIMNSWIYNLEMYG
ncbi:MAG: HEAT repeat domain-containing protein [Candidatus Flexifilum sp.]|jgi:hypothetical protein